MKNLAYYVLVLWLPLVLAAGCTGNLDLEAARTFQKAQETFDKATTPEDYLRAAALYQEILDRGIVSGAILFDQGNAFMKAHERGRAIAAYRQANRYRPRDPYLEANLQYALGTPGMPDPDKPLMEYVFFWQNCLGYHEKFVLAFGLAAIAVALGVAAIFFSRRSLHRTAAAVALLLAIACCSAGYDWYRFTQVTRGVTIGEVVARKGNAAGYEPALSAPVAEGTEFRLLDARGDWLWIRLAGGQEGWIDRAGAVLY